jgi:diguanylate cyclase (GGDEF)-like protein/PAS domain S-box-containing protein
MLENLPIRTRLLGIVLVVLAALSLVCWAGLREIDTRLMAERQAQCKMMVAQVFGYLRKLDEDVRAGRIDEGWAREHALEDISAMASTGSSYVWISDLSARVLWHPSPELVGVDASTLTDVDGRPIFRLFIERTALGGAFISYRWPKPGFSQPEEKLSYVERFVPWGWVVGSGIYMDDVAEAWQMQAWRFGLLTALAALAATLATWTIGNSVVRPLRRLTHLTRRLTRGEEVVIPDTARRDEVGELTRAIALFKDSLADREAAQRARDMVLRETKTVFDHISEGVLVTDAGNHIKLVNPAFTRITGYRPHEVIGRNPSMLASGRHDVAFYQAMYQSLHDQGFWQGELWNRNKAGRIYPESMSIAVVKSPEGETEGFVATFTDITEFKRREDGMRWQAEHDDLTGLPNRAHFQACLTQGLERAVAQKARLALLFIDLDGFKPINDEYGHATGDLVLRAVAERIRGTVRGSDLVARLGGDEFVVLIEDVNSIDDAGQIAGKLVASLGEPLSIEGRRLVVGASIGVALFPDDATTWVDLVASADLAMYRAKSQGGGRYCVEG